MRISGAVGISPPLVCTGRSSSTFTALALRPATVSLASVIINDSFRSSPCHCGLCHTTAVSNVHGPPPPSGSPLPQWRANYAGAGTTQAYEARKDTGVEAEKTVVVCQRDARERFDPVSSGLIGQL